MQSDGGVLYTQIESQLPTFIQNDHTQFTKFIEKYYEKLAMIGEPCSNDVQECGNNEHDDMEMV